MLKKILLSIRSIFLCFTCTHSTANHSQQHDHKHKPAQSIYDKIPIQQNKEVFTSLLHDRNVLIQRIISNGQTTPEAKPYCQEQDEWIIVLQGEAQLKLAKKGLINLTNGEYYFIPRHTKHWVTYTSKNPKVIWLTIHIFNQSISKKYNPDHTT